MKREKGEGGKFRLKEIVFYNLFLYLFDIIEILIIKIKYFFKNLQGNPVLEIVLYS